jgi:hypothetical protein
MESTEKGSDRPNNNNKKKTVHSTSLVMVQKSSNFSRSVVEWFWKMKGKTDFGNQQCLKQHAMLDRRDISHRAGHNEEDISITMK